MKITLRKVCFFLLAFGSIGAFANAETDNQNFTVSVPERLAITAPSAQTITHDETDDPQAFTAQSWLVEGNAINGVSVTFATATAFQNTTDISIERNVQLDLALGSVAGPATWSIDTATDTTDYSTSDGIAQVAASSDGAGTANLLVTVTFITETFGLFAAGDYTTTVTGTVTANP